MTENSDLIGVSVAKGTNSGSFYLRFLIRDSHLIRVGGPDRMMIRGQADNGFILAPDTEGKKISRGAFAGGGYLQETIANFELSAIRRKRIDVRPEFENGHIRIPPLPPAWIDGTGEFAAAIEEGNREMELPASPVDDAMRLTSVSVPINGHPVSPTVPPAKPTLAYAVPADATMQQMQAQLGGKLDEARALIRAMEQRTGMKFTLDRNLRLVVSLPPV